MPTGHLTIGVIGCGRRGRGHMEALSAVESTRIVAVSDPVESSRASAAATYDAEPFSNGIELLESAKPDAVVVAAPAHLNFEAALPVIESGATVLLEKPPGLSLAETQRLASAARSSGAKVMVGFDRRFNPLVTEAMQRIVDQGPPRQIVAEFHKDIRDWTEDPRFTETMFDRLMLESPIHSIDLMIFLTGSAVSAVESRVQRANSKYRNVHAALIEFESGCVAQFTASLSAGGRLERYEIHGDGISAYLEGVNEASIAMNGNQGPIELSDPTPTSTQLQDAFFVEQAPLDGPFPEPAATLESAVLTMELAEKIYG